LTFYITLATGNWRISGLWPRPWVEGQRVGDLRPSFATRCLFWVASCMLAYMLARSGAPLELIPFACSGQSSALTGFCARSRNALRLSQIRLGQSEPPERQVVPKLEQYR